MFIVVPKSRGIKSVSPAKETSDASYPIIEYAVFTPFTTVVPVAIFELSVEPKNPVEENCIEGVTKIRL